jgi:hypothetical protein
VHRLRHLCQGLPHGDSGDRRKVSSYINGRQNAARFSLRKGWIFSAEML